MYCPSFSVLLTVFCQDNSGFNFHPREIGNLVILESDIIDQFPVALPKGDIYQLGPGTLEFVFKCVSTPPIRKGKKPTK